MKVRPFTKDDVNSYAQMVRYCFNMSLKDSEQYAKGIIKFCRGFVAEEKSKAFSASFYYPFHQNIHGKKFKMAGIGGVVTMPEARNRGMVREQFKVIQKDMLEQGYVTSCLQPFKPTYYQKKFGWANASQRLKSRIRVCDIAETKEEFEFIRIDSPLPKHFSNIEKAFTSLYNGSSYRDKLFWEEDIMFCWGQTKELYYYLIRHGGKDVAYLIFSYQNSKKDYGVDLIVRDYGYVNYIGAKGLFALFRKHIDQAGEVVISLPENFDLYHFAPCNLHSIMWQSFMMFRVVDIKNAMLGYNIPKDLSFDFTLQISDPLAGEQPLSYAFHIENGSIKLIEKSTHVLKCPVDSFSRMFIGRNSIHDLIAYGEVEISHEIIENIDRLFPKDIVFIKDMF